MRYLRTYNESLDANSESEVNAIMIDLFDLDFYKSKGRSADGFPYKYLYKCDIVTINKELIDAFKMVLRRLKNYGYSMSYFKLNNEHFNKPKIAHSGLVDSILPSLEALIALYGEFDVNNFNINVFEESRMIEHKLINDLYSLYEDETKSYSYIEKSNTESVDDSGKLGPNELVEYLTNQLISKKGWSLESIQETAKHITYNASEDGLTDLFLYHYNKTTDLGGFRFNNEMESASCNHETLVKIGYGYHKTKYGSIRHTQNFGSNREDLLNRLFDIAMITSIFNNDSDIASVSNLATELGSISIPCYNILKYLNSEAKGLIKLSNTINSYTINFSATSLYNLMIPNDIISLDEFISGLSEAFDELDSTTNGMIVGSVSGDNATLKLHMYL